MKVAELLDRRRKYWQELERLSSQMQAGGKKSLGAAGLMRFSVLYRAACADLALADAYQLPPSTIQYLHRLVGRAHNQLYRARMFYFRNWLYVLLVQVPQTVFQDRCVQIAFLLFYGCFFLSGYCAYRQDLFPTYAEDVLSAEMLTTMEEMHSTSARGGTNPLGTTGYIYHNAGIGLKCFISGVLIIPGLFITMFNAFTLGAVFGYMARPDIDIDVRRNFFQFVTAHGPFELTAIVLASGAGLRLGVSWLKTHGMTRIGSIRAAANRAMPVMGSAIVMFCIAGFIEATISPADLSWLGKQFEFVPKVAVAVFSAGALTFYFVLLGFPRSRSRAT